MALNLNTISSPAPWITNGQDRVTAAQPGDRSRWVYIDRNELQPGDPFKEWGIVETFERSVVNIGVEDKAFRVYTSYPGEWEYNRIWQFAVPAVNQKDPRPAQLQDWLHIPGSFFLSHWDRHTDTPSGRFSPEFFGPIVDFNTSNVHPLENHRLYNFNVTDSLKNSQQSGSIFYQSSWGRSARVIRPAGPEARVTFKNDSIIQLRPNATYLLPGDLKIKYLDNPVTTNRSIKIGRYRGEKRLTRDLYIYNTAKDALSSDTFTAPVTTSFILTSDQIFNVSRFSTTQVVQINLVDSPSLDQRQTIRGGNLGNGMFEIPSDSMFAGLSDVSLPILEVGQRFIRVQLTPDQYAIADPILATGGTALSGSIRFTREVDLIPALAVISITDVPDKEQIDIEFNRLSTPEQAATLDTILETAQQIFIPKSSTFLGIGGVQIFDITKVQKQTDTFGAIISVSTIGYDGAALARTPSPYTDGRFIIGNFSIGGPGVISDVDDTTAAALRQNGQYSYKLLWSYIDENSNKIIGAPSESLYITRKEGQRPVDIDLVITIPDEILESTNINDYTFEIFRSSRSANASTVPRQDEGLVFTGAVEYDEATRQPFKRMVVTDKNPELATVSYTHLTLPTKA